MACGLLELSKHVEQKREYYEETAASIVRSLYLNYFLQDPDHAGILKESLYHREIGSCCTVFGDYFYVEAIPRLLKDDWLRYW
ncbi:MAG: hypothetical protein IJ390_05095 [Lachnospiraceae bacterium]|nr:hypothetical protein [Lachnospiraceae bacterium]